MNVVEFDTWTGGTSVSTRHGMAAYGHGTSTVPNKELIRTGLACWCTPVLWLWHHDGSESCTHASAEITGFACSHVVRADNWRKENEMKWKVGSRVGFTIPQKWSSNERDNVSNNLILLSSLLIPFSWSGIYPLPMFLPAAASSLFSILSLHPFTCACLLTFLSSCLPSLRELSNNRSLDNLDCIEGTVSSLPHWDDDDFSQACSTLGRRSCMGQVSNIVRLYYITVNSLSRCLFCICVFLMMVQVCRAGRGHYLLLQSLLISSIFLHPDT